MLGIQCVTVFPSFYRSSVLTKVGRPEGCSMTWREWESATPGEGDAGGRSLKVGYCLEGEVLSPIEVGKMICVLRRKRNGRKVRGLFVGSPVVEIGPGRIVTKNAIYAVEFGDHSRRLVYGGDENKT